MSLDRFFRFSPFGETHLHAKAALLPERFVLRLLRQASVVPELATPELQDAVVLAPYLQAMVGLFVGGHAPEETLHRWIGEIDGRWAVFRGVVARLVTWRKDLAAKELAAAIGEALHGSGASVRDGRRTREHLIAGRPRLYRAVASSFGAEWFQALAVDATSVQALDLAEEGFEKGVSEERLAIAVARYPDYPLASWLGAYRHAKTALIDAMQEATIAAAEKKHIFVEANPTSNRIIGAFQNTKSLPFFKLAERLKVTLSTDDPTLTGSCLANEYEVVFHALCDSGKSHAAALAELDRFRQHGVAALFRDPEDSAHARKQLQPLPSGCRDCQEPRPRSR